MCYSLTWTRLAHVCRLFTLIAVFFKPISCRGPLAAKVLWRSPWNWQQGGWETNLANPPMRRLEMFFPTKSFPKVGLLQLKDSMCVLWQHLVVRKYSAKKWHIYLSGRSLCSWLYCPFSFICGGKKWTDYGWIWRLWLILQKSCDFGIPLQIAHLLTSLANSICESPPLISPCFLMSHLFLYQIPAGMSGLKSPRPNYIYLLSYCG